MTEILKSAESFVKIWPGPGGHKDEEFMAEEAALKTEDPLVKKDWKTRMKTLTGMKGEDSSYVLGSS